MSWYTTYSLNFADKTCPKKTLMGVSESYISESPAAIVNGCGLVGVATEQTNKQTDQPWLMKNLTRGSRSLALTMGA